MSREFLWRNGLKLSGFDGGAGLPVVFQHGLGGDGAQVAEVFPPGFRRLTLECRSHGASDDGEQVSIAAFADDVLAFADHCGVERFAVGGISMGAAIALAIAVKVPRRVLALILARPAWTWGTAPDNMQVFADVARFLEEGGRDAFEATAIARRMAKEAPDNLASLRGFFERPGRARLPPLLKAIAADGPGVSELQVQAIRVPTLVIANAVDLVHPQSLARDLASAISGAQFVEIAPKATDRPRHVAEFRASVAEFLEHLKAPA